MNDDLNDININELFNSLDNGSEENKEYSNDSKPSISKVKILLCFLIGVFVSFIVFLIVASLYTNYIRFPSKEEVDYTTTGAFALDKYIELVHSQQGLSDEDYLVKEIDYANSNKNKLAFINKMVNTIKYEPKIVNAKNVYGNDMINRETMEVVKEKSNVNNGEEVYFTYVDYDSIVFDEESIKNKINEYDLTKDNIVYSNVLVDMFCDYIYSIEDVPVKTISRVPYLSKVKEEGTNEYTVVSDEDIYIDKLLFSSDEFESCKTRFTEVVGKELLGTDFKVSEEWEEWNNLSKIKKESTIEPLKYGKFSMSNNWCGAYKLQNGVYFIDENGNKIIEEVKPQLGDGSIESPASINTPIVTSVLTKNNNGTYTENFIKVELIEFGVSEKAIEWFQSKHIQNRGYNLESEVQYCYYVFKITNLSNNTVIVNDNSSLCDKNGNLSSKTGTIFGLKSNVILKPGEEGYIESWGRSTELYKKYLIWGADFEKQLPLVWFRVLAGDFEDTSEYKGVHIINQSRLDSSIEESKIDNDDSKK